jgi:glycosyltransferase involved in cell wall biosynthesis
LPRRLADPLVKAFVRSGDAWMAYGTRSSADLVSLGADPARIVVAPLVARPASEHVGQKDRSGSEPFRYLFVGRLIERKGVEVLLDAFRTVEGGELWIAGDGPLDDVVSQASRSDGRIRVLGHREDTELDELYSAADCLVVPSHYEVWGLVVNEAQAYGVPVIASDQVGAAADLIDPGVNGFVFPTGSAQALAEAMRDVASWSSDQRADCAARCREKLERHSVDSASTAMFDACAIALEHRHGRRAGSTRTRATR